MADFDNETLERTQVRTRTRVPKQYHVIMKNDDVTPMEYVVKILLEIFHLDMERAFLTMLNIHTHDEGIVGTYTRSEAYAKVDAVEAENAEYGFDLRVDVRGVNN